MQQFVSILLLNFLTSIDNAIILAGIANRQNKNLLSIALTSSVVITILRTALIMGIVSIVKWPGLRLALGIIVLIVALNLAHVPMEVERTRASFWRVLSMVVVTDMALSLDNILSIAVISKNSLVIASSVFLSLLPLLLLLPFIVQVMDKVLWLRILAAGFVAELAIDSITDDPILAHHTPTGRAELVIRLSSAIIVVIYGFWQTYAKRRPIS